MSVLDDVFDYLEILATVKATYVVSPETLDAINSSIQAVMHVTDRISPRSFAACLRGEPWKKGTELTEPFYRIKNASLEEIADVIRSEEGSEGKILGADIPERILANTFPVLYDTAKDGDYLYKANFSYNRFRVGSDFHWQQYLQSGAEVAEGYALKMNAADVAAKDNRYIGTFPIYDLENKTYTYELEYFRNFADRHKFYFACGTFINLATGGTMQDCGCDPSMPCLAIQLAYSDGKIRYLLVRQSTNAYRNTENMHNTNTVDFAFDDNGEFTAKLKVVLNCGAKKTVTLYNNYGEIPPTTDAVYNWRGEVIPIDFKIYHVVNGKDMLVASGGIYQPADIPLVCGIGNAEKPSESEYYGVRNLVIYKGDTVNIQFTINGTAYRTPKGTTWQMFVDDNADLGFAVKNGLVYLNHYKIKDGESDVSAESYIIDTETYVTHGWIIGSETILFKVELLNNADSYLSATHAAIDGMAWIDIAHPDCEAYDSSFVTDSNGVLYINGEFDLVPLKTEQGNEITQGERIEATVYYV